MKRSCAALAALLCWFLPTVRAAEDLNVAVRELARRTAGLAGKGEPVAVVWHNLSSLNSSVVTQARSVFEAALRDSGARPSEIAPIAEAQITISENAARYLLVEEIHKGDERQVWIAGWTRGSAPAIPASAVALQKKLLWEQDEPVLDAASTADRLLVLAAGKVTVLWHEGAQWELHQTLSISSARPWPRDLRGHLRVNGSTVQINLPGVACSGSIADSLTLECRNADEVWVLESGSRSMLLANLAAGRDYFDGRVTNQSGVRKTVAPFFAAAASEDGGRPVWLLTTIDRRTQIVDASFEPGGTIAGWGSDIVGTDARCGSWQPVLATRAGDAGEADTLQAFGIANRAAVPVGAPLEFPGPVTALWPRGGEVTAVVHDLTTGKWQVYVVAVACG